MGLGSRGIRGILLITVLGGCSLLGKSSIDVIAQQGDVRVRCDRVEWAELNDEFALGRDCEFSTRTDGLLALQLGEDSAIELRAWTQIRVFPSKPPPEIEVTRGEIYVRAEPKEVPPIAVRTPVVAVGIRGTTFTVLHDPATGQSTVTVVEGRVQAAPLDTAIAPVELQAGQQVHVAAHAISPVMPAPAVPPPVLLEAAAAKDTGLWELWNSIRHQLEHALSLEEAHHDGDEAEPPPTPASGFGAMQFGMDIADGADYSAVDIPDAQPLSCQQVCAADPRCRAYAYVIPGTYNYPNARCWLKAQPGRFVAHANAVSAVKEEVQMARGTIEVDIDRPGSDFSNFDLPQPEPGLCMQSCQQVAACVAYTYVKPGVQGPSARCWLKNSVPAPVSNPCCVSGFMHR